MPRPCSVCQSLYLPEIASAIASGVSDVQIAKRYGVSRQAVQRHRTHVGAPNSAVVADRRCAAFTALATLPTADEVNGAYASIAARIDAVAAKAESEGSLAVALMGLKELRSTVTAQAHLAGHVGSGASVQVNTQVNVDVGAAVKELIAAIQKKARQDAAISPDTTPDNGAIPSTSLSPADADASPAMLSRLEAIVDGE
jgi:hypothetical protein